MQKVHLIVQNGEQYCWNPGVSIVEADISEVFDYTKQKRLPILNSPIAFPGFLIYAQRINEETARALVEEAARRGIAVDSYIGHDATARLASQLGTEVSVRRAMYQPNKNEIAIVFRLKKRLSKLEDVKNVKPEDIEILVLHYYC